MNSNNDNTIKLSTKEYYREYYRIYQNQNRDKIRENCRRYYHNKVVDDNYRLALNKKTLELRHNRVIRNGIAIKARGRPRKVNNIDLKT